MKFMKFVLASLAVSCAFTATAFAAELSSDYNYTYSVEVTPATVNAGDTVEVAVYMSATDASGNPIDSITIPEDNDATLGVGLNFKDDVISIAVSKDTVKTGTELANMYRKTKVNGTNNITMFYDGTYGVDIGEITPETALVTYTFTVSADATTATYDSSNPLVTLEAKTTEMADTLGNKSTLNKTMAACNTVNVVGTAPTPVGPSITDAGNGVKDISGAATADLNGKKVVFQDASFPTGHKIGTATQLKITNNNLTTDNVRYFGSNLLETLLGVQAVDGATFEASKVKFGIVFDATYTDWTAANFVFELVNTVE